MTSSCTRRGRGRSASRSPWTWPISFLPNRYSVPPNRCGTATTPGQEVTAARISSPGLFTTSPHHSRHSPDYHHIGRYLVRPMADRLRRQQIDHRTHVAAVLEGVQLAIRARPFAKDRVHVVHRVPRAEVVDHVVDELEQLESQIPHR